MSGAELQLQPWMKPGVNYSNPTLAPEYCSQDGGVWNASGKWCTPVPGSNYTVLLHNAMEHGHNAIGYYGDAPRTYMSPSFKMLALLVGVTMLLSTIS